MFNCQVATGQVIAPSIGQTRTEADFLAHIQQTVVTDPTGVWIFITEIEYSSIGILGAVGHSCLWSESGFRG